MVVFGLRRRSGMGMVEMVSRVYIAVLQYASVIGSLYPAKGGAVEVIE